MKKNYMSKEIKTARDWPPCEKKLFRAAVQTKVIPMCVSLHTPAIGYK
jgi:hypothetical protein